MTRIRAFIYHLLMSVVIVSAVLAIVIFFWYPNPFFKIIGAMDVIKVLIFVDLVLGPLLTLVLFKPDKWGLKFDMACVFAMQICALVYGVYTVYEERPYYMVFVQDRFEVLARRDIDETQIVNDVFRDKPWTQPVYVVATMPTDLKERQRILEETLFQGLPDIHQRPEYWHQYDGQRAHVARAAKPLAALLAKRPDKAAQINAAFRDYALGERLAYVPVTARGRALTMLLDSETWNPVGALDIDPWQKLAARAAAGAPADSARQIAAN